MTFANPLPWWVLVPALAAAAALAYRAYAPGGVLARPRRRLLVTLRFLTLVLLLLLLMRPVIVLPASGPRDAIVPVLVDTSRSMQIADVDDRPRLDHARTLLTDQLVPMLGKEFTVKIHAFGDQLSDADPVELEAAGAASDLLGALQAVREEYRGQDLAAVVVVTDGGDTGTRALAGSSLAGDLPVFVIGVGAPTIQRDREVLSVTAGQATLQDSTVQLSASVVSHGYGDEPFMLRLLENGLPIHVRRVQPTRDGAPVREGFQVSPASDAATLYTVEIPQESDELVAANNSRAVLVHPPGPPRRVLVVQGAPGYEHGFLMRALASDPGLEPDAVVRKGQNDRGEETFYVQASPERSGALGMGFPDSRRALFDYDAIVLANVTARLLGLDALDSIEEFVNARGGGLLVLGAESFGRPGFIGTAIEPVLPLELDERWEGAEDDGSSTIEPNRVIVTIDGLSHPVMRLGGSGEASRAKWLTMPPLGGGTSLGGPRAGASLLAVTIGPGGAAQPLVAVQRYGRGRALVFTGEAAWRWRMLMPLDDTTYERFWQQAVRWLASSTPAQVATTMTGGAIAGRTVSVEIQVRDEEFEPAPDASISVTVNGPGLDHLERSAELIDAHEGRYGFEFQADLAGVYRVTSDVRRAGVALDAPDGWILVGGADRELTDPRRNDEMLQRVTAATGGRLMAAADVESLAGLLRARATDEAPTAYRDVWHSGWISAFIVGLLCAEWVLRRQAGLR